MLTAMPCSWPVLECGPLPEPEDTIYEPLRDAAAEILWALSGRQFGCCEKPPWRPCRDNCVGYRHWLGPALFEGQWINVFCRACGPRRCSCKEVHEIRLPGTVCEIIEVTIDGDVVPTGSYRVDDLSWLVRTDGDKWPTCQDMNLNLGEVGTWGVRYSTGPPVPVGGQRAAGEMMSELWKACKNDSTCCLPKRAILDARKGLQGLDPMEFLLNGKTGLYFTDLWLSAVNPKGRPSGAIIVSPDYDPGRETTWP